MYSFQSKGSVCPPSAEKTTGTERVIEFVWLFAQTSYRSDSNHGLEITNQLRSVLAFIYRIIYATNTSALLQGIKMPSNPLKIKLVL